MTIPAPLLRVENLQKRFVHEGQRLDVLRGVNLEVQAGEMLAEIGRAHV